MVLINSMVTVQLIGTFVFTYEKSMISHNAADIVMMQSQSLLLIHVIAFSDVRICIVIFHLCFQKLTF